ncbi:hypothetical protein ACFFJY_19780 [Fictibacillus aquaticus]|uniref:hypothetical protein n=1 Tax=Fictibacillus aquaticus TaxID=2021314 RepID=UPI0010568309|nr:hypothetical protein [Fictibacillus aquaticus]
MNWSSSGKGHDLRQLQGDIFDIIQDEWSVMKDVHAELNEQEKLSSEESTKLSELIQARYEAIHNYNRSVNNEKQEALNAETERVLKLINDYAENARTE